MRIYETFGQNTAVAAFSTKALIELTRAPEPEAALEEVVARKEQGEDITAKQAKALVRIWICTEMISHRRPGDLLKFERISMRWQTTTPCQRLQIWIG